MRSHVPTMHTMHRLSAVLSLALALLAAGCASSTHRAPVEERSAPQRSAANPSAAVIAGTAPSQTADVAPKALPGAENAGKANYYTVKPGDTLIRVGLDNGQNWRDIARWSALENPNVIEVGQVLRVAPPSADVGGVVARPVAAGGRLDGRPLDAKLGATAVAPAGAGAAATVPPLSGPAAGAVSGPVAVAPPVVPAALPLPVVPGNAQAPRDPDEEVSWAWPASGPVATPFDDAKSKGLAITGKAGDPVLAAADGRVVYAGSGLRGYGNLVIVKHNALFLTAYAHNQALLVKEDQVVRRGQKIAEMGASDAERVQLHFEIRRQGKPVDPARLLPAR